MSLSNKIKIIIDDKIPFIKEVLEPYARVIYLPGNKIAKSDVIDADALIIRTRTKCNKALLANSAVKFIATATIGYDHIDTIYCDENNIQWTNAVGCNSSSVNQYVTSVLLNLSVKYKLPLKNKILGIIGVGNVGEKVKKNAELLGMQVLLNDPPRERAGDKLDFHSLDRVIQNSDFITIHTPLNLSGIDKTFHLVDEVFLKKMKNNAFLINSSRGEVINTNALLQILKIKQITGAVLDVWENEPNINQDLLNIADIATPHIAGYSADGKANGTKMSVQALSKFFKLGIDNWKVTQLPELKNINLNLSQNKEIDEDELLKYYNQYYDVMDDDKHLRNNIDDFEKLRGNYPIRREMELRNLLY